jgi:hypothetical protein
VVRDGLIGDLMGRRDRQGFAAFTDEILNDHNTPKLHT